MTKKFQRYVQLYTLTTLCSAPDFIQPSFHIASIRQLKGMEHGSAIGPTPFLIPSPSIINAEDVSWPRTFSSRLHWRVLHDSSASCRIDSVTKYIRKLAQVMAFIYWIMVSKLSMSVHHTNLTWVYALVLREQFESNTWHSRNAPEYLEKR
jgi:hypothetical protein